MTRAERTPEALHVRHSDAGRDGGHRPHPAREARVRGVQAELQEVAVRWQAERGAEVPREVER